MMGKVSPCCGAAPTPQLKGSGAPGQTSPGRGKEPAQPCEGHGLFRVFFFYKRLPEVGGGIKRMGIEEWRLSFGIGSQNLSRVMKGKRQLKQEQSRAAALGTGEALKLRGWQI